MPNFSNTLSACHAGELPSASSNVEAATHRFDAGVIDNGSRYEEQPLPYGSMPRYMLAWFNTFAIRNKTSEIPLGHSARDFMERIGYTVSGGKRGTYTTFRNQAKALAACRLVLTIGDLGCPRTHFKGDIVDEFEAWLDLDGVSDPPGILTRIVPAPLDPEKYRSSVEPCLYKLTNARRRYIVKGFLFVAFLAAVPILSADVSTSVSCTVYGTRIIPGSSITDPHSCELQDIRYNNFAIASATANASFSLASDPNSFSSVVVNQHAYGGNSVDRDGNFVTSTAASQVFINEDLFTTGSMRSGFVQIGAMGSITPTFRENSAALDLSLGPIAVGCFNQGSFASTCVLWPNGAHSIPGYLLPVDGQYYPLTLGQAFSFSYLSYAVGVGDVFGSGEGDTNMQFQFRFFEADGVTPVSVEAVPEPKTFALEGIALGVLAVSRKFLCQKRRSQ